MTYILKKIIWHEAHEAKKWALLSWNQLIKTKTAGGLGLRDPFRLKQVMGENSSGDGFKVVLIF